MLGKSLLTLSSVHRFTRAVITSVPAALPFTETLSFHANSFHTDSMLMQQAAAKGKTAAAGAPSTAASLRPDEKVYDYKPVLPRHQAVFTPTHKNAVQWTPQSKRVGVVALKAGMAGDYDQWGVRRALTALKLESVQVTNIIQRGYTALQIGAGIPKPKNVNKPQAGYFAKLGVEPSLKLAEFRVSPDAVLPIGTEINIRHFMPGQYVNVTSVSQGKGFQGGMKRHNFAGQKASHGNSVSHRALGSTGCRQDPGKVMKGKKMPGQLGGNTVTVECLRVYKIDIKRNLLYVEGAVPGKPGTYVRIVDAPKKAFREEPPFPTYTPSDTHADLDRKMQAAWEEGAYLDPAQEAALAAEGKLPEGYVLEPAYELVMTPPAVDPFAIPENDEAEEV